MKNLVVFLIPGFFFFGLVVTANATLFRYSWNNCALDDKPPTLIITWDITNALGGSIWKDISLNEPNYLNNFENQSCNLPIISQKPIIYSSTQKPTNSSSTQKPAKSSNTVPEPTTMMLLGIGLVTLAGSRMRKKLKN